MIEVIKATNISVVRGKREILRVDELALCKGEMLSVIGPNGAGKSTLLLVLALLITPAAGEIIFMGQPVKRGNVLSFRRRMALVFQEPLLLNTTVFNNVAEGLKFRGVPRGEINRRVEFWLDKMGISHLAGRNTRFLSGGEAQRVSLARALVLQPEVLFLDEPFSALDFPTRKDLIGQLSGIIRENGITTFFVTHDYSEIPYFPGRVAVVDSGRIVREGEAKSLFYPALADLPAASLKTIYN
jgi:tungstate transport system ATP-binding protein